MKEIKNPDEYEVCKFDGVTAARVYSGSLTELKREELQWLVDAELTEAFGFEAEVLTLSEIWDQVSKKSPIVTVIIDGPFSGVILQAGNYADNSWWEIGNVSGYA